MGIAKKTDGRYVVGLGVNNANEYKGSASYRDIYIQLTADGATEESVEYLTYLKDYAVYANAQGEPIMPPSVNVWISNNGKTTAVEADDLSLDGDNYTICGIVWNGSSWDYSNAGQGHGGGGGGGGLPSYTPADEGKVLGLAEDSGTVAPAWVSGKVYSFSDTLNNALQTLLGGALNTAAINYRQYGDDYSESAMTSDDWQTVVDIHNALTKGKVPIVYNLNMYVVGITSIEDSGDITVRLFIPDFNYLTYRFDVTLTLTAYANSNTYTHVGVNVLVPVLSQP